MATAVIIPTGGANLASLQFALQRLGKDVQVSHDPEDIRAASHVLLPGVGAAQDAMARLRDIKLHDLLPTLKQPVLGICLGMQLLFDGSAEDNATCLGIIAGRAQQFVASNDLPVPQMGWNQIQACISNPLLVGVPSGSYCYFVHSYALPVGVATIAESHYGVPFSAVVARDNFFGTQFHPERSGRAGAQMLANFLDL